MGCTSGRENKEPYISPHNVFLIYPQEGQDYKLG